MFVNIARAAAFLMALPLFAVASPLEARNGDCSTGPVQCCNSLQSDTTGLNPVVAAAVAALLPIDGPQVGVTCNPISLIAGGTCNGKTVCCKDNNVGGPNSLVSVGCIIVTV